ncbi:hypothetical protein Tco_0241420 [Tanacetum coccineum]
MLLTLTPESNRECKKQTIVATSTTEAEYVAAASCCGQVLWIQNQLLDYGYNFMNTVINIDNNNITRLRLRYSLYFYALRACPSMAFRLLTDLTEIDLFSFIRIADPTKVRVSERQRTEGEPKLLDTIVGRVVPLLPGDSVSGGHGVGILQVSETAEIVVEDAAPVSVLQRLLAGAVLNPEVGIAALPTLPFITSYVSVTPDRDNSSHHSGANIAEAEVDSFARPSIPLMTVATTVTSTVDPATTVKEKFVESSIFGGDSSGGGADHTVGGFSDLTGSDFIVGGIRTVISPDVNLQKVYVPQWSVTIGSHLDDGRAASQMSLSAEVRMRAEYNIRERRRLNYVVEEKSSLLKARDAEIESLKAQLLVKEAKAAKAIRLRAKASKFEVIEKSLQGEVIVLKYYNTTLEKEKSELDVKVVDLVASVKVREQEAADLDAMVTSVKSQNDNLVDQVHELETSSSGLQEKVTAYENCMGNMRTILTI